MGRGNEQTVGSPGTTGAPGAAAAAGAASGGGAGGADGSTLCTAPSPSACMPVSMYECMDDSLTKDAILLISCTV